MKSNSVRFPCDDITLEGEWLIPEGSGPFPVVIVCHPFPPHGGSMESSVVMAIWEALSRQSIASLRFNFRGVDGSEGSFGEGIAEREDVKAAIEFARSYPGVDKSKIGLAGYSFGGAVVLPVTAGDTRVNRLAIISSPLSGDSWKMLNDYDKPKLYLIGDNDQMLPLETYLEQTKDVKHPEQYRLIPGADHFLVGYEEKVGSIVADFFAEGFSTV